MSNTDRQAPELVVARELALFAPYAMHSADTAGRQHPEAVHPYRGPFQRDRDRITHSAAFRRLSGKLQVFTGEMGEYHRTRLTHTLEVASIARTIGRGLRLNEDLIEALALLHDLGHPPFGHAGEEVLADCLAEHGGFDHNRHTLRIVEVLEQTRLSAPGLNLSREVLAGQRARSEKATAKERPLLEVQVVDAADNIAYSAHDADDALVLGLLSLDELLETPLWKAAAARVQAAYADLSPDELRRGTVHELIDWQVGNLLNTTAARLVVLGVKSIAKVRTSPTLVAPDRELSEMQREHAAFLFERVYRHPLLIELRARVREMFAVTFARLIENPELAPAAFRSASDHPNRHRAAGDYLACLTDRAFQSLYEQLA